ncbi:MAG TPA: UvrD-helicase domain-containing protein [Tepidisphaeraceae bacterium]|nr:UvrD-helicase domain-containing protein [Tepidisphaeraceae bacterium]
MTLLLFVNVLAAEEILADLTPAQREAATHVDGPLLIIAGAGSGKTRVITRRVAYLLSLGIVPSSILAITFTNKAAGEMKSRISASMDRPLRDFGRLDQPWPIICTFHSLGLRLLRHYADRINLPANFSVYDSSDQERILKESIKAVDLSTTNFPASAVHAAISSAKNKLISPESFAQSSYDFYAKNVARVYTQYEKLLKQNNALDFDDLLLRPAYLFRNHPEILKELQQKFQYILIDEYQDTNHAQYIIAHSLALAHRNLCVVGDPDQSIYAWRGADIQNILDFEKDYPDAKVVKLEQNYRSTQTILDIASGLISHNRQRKDKRLWTENARGDNAKLFLTADEHAEAQSIVMQFKELSEQGHPWSDMAVFYRINALSRVMEDALRRAGVPYRIARGVDFYHRKEIKDVLAYLRVIANPDDELSLTRIINVPARGIGDNSVRQMQVHAINNGWNLWQTLKNIGQIPNVSTRGQAAAKSFIQLVERWRAMNKPASPTDPLPSVRNLMDDVVKTSGLEAYLKKTGGAELEELANVNELISSAAQYEQENPGGSLDDYLAQISLVSDVDSLAETGGAVTLMTLHAAKGLEFPIVAMIGMEEGSLPHARVREHPEQLEEERRLAFVGITRARQRLIFSRAKYRQIRGLRERTAASRFLTEMPLELLEIIDHAEAGLGGDRASERRMAEMESQRLSSQFHRGQTVRHPQFGLGKISDISNLGQQTRAIIEFQKFGRKTLILQYARLEPVGA